MLLNVRQWYLAAASLALVLYLLSGPSIYMTIWAGWPSIRPLGILSAVVPLLIVARVWMAVSGRIPVRGNAALAGFLLLSWITAIQAVTFFTQGQEIGQAFFLTVPLTFTATWALWLGGEALLNLSPRHQNRVLGGMFTALCATAIYGIYQGWANDGQPVLDFYRAGAGVGSGAAGGEIQFDFVSITDPIALLGVLVIARLTRRSGWAAILGIFTAALLFLCFSRTSFALFLAGGTILAVFQARSAKWWRAIAVVALLGLAGAALSGAGSQLLDTVQTSVERMGIVATDLADDSSFVARGDFLETGLVDLGKYWLTGQFLADAIERVRGEYVHNWLSFWISYGIGPFLLSVVLMLAAARRAWFSRNLGVLAVTIIVIGGCILTRSYIWTYIWFALSLAAHLPRAHAQQVVHEEARDRDDLPYLPA